MEKLTRLSTEQRDNLTAYLDGELDEDGTRQIETVLAGSTVARNDVEALAKTYELLDLLPRPKASGAFTEKTMQTAKLGEVRMDPRQTVWYRHGKRIIRWGSWAALLFVAACVGYSIARYQVPQPEDVLLDNVEVIQKLDDYEKAGSFEFLDALSHDSNLLKRMGGGRAVP
jgi:anti-sigma factor RsiW